MKYLGIFLEVYFLIHKYIHILIKYEIYINMYINVHYFYIFAPNWNLIDIKVTHYPLLPFKACMYLYFYRMIQNGACVNQQGNDEVVHHLD